METTRVGFHIFTTEGLTESVPKFCTGNERVENFKPKICWKDSVICALTSCTCVDTS